jgi:hypothetical protein
MITADLDRRRLCSEWVVYQNLLGEFDSSCNPGRDIMYYQCYHAIQAGQLENT